jgi:hypothetical protein
LSAGVELAGFPQFWVIWTLVQVYALPLSVIQFATIFIAYSIAPKGNKEVQQVAASDVVKVALGVIKLR